MTFSASQTLREVALRFNKTYPNLQLVFFYPEKRGEYDRMGAVKDLDQPIGAVGNGNLAAHISVSKNLRISEFEALFLDVFGLGVSVLRNHHRLEKSEAGKVAERKNDFGNA